MYRMKIKFIDGPRNFKYREYSGKPPNTIRIPIIPDGIPLLTADDEPAFPEYKEATYERISPLAMAECDLGCSNYINVEYKNELMRARLAREAELKKQRHCCFCHCNCR